MKQSRDQRKETEGELKKNNENCSKIRSDDEDIKQKEKSKKNRIKQRVFSTDLFNASRTRKPTTMYYRWTVKMMPT